MAPDTPASRDRDGQLVPRRSDSGDAERLSDNLSSHGNAEKAVFETGATPEPVTSPGEEASDVSTPPMKANSLASLPPGRKNLLFICFCLALFIDSAGISATLLMTAPIAADLEISQANVTWIPTSYTVAFASSLLLSGRIADLYSPAKLYSIGFAGEGILYLVLSFVRDQYSFLVLRAVKGLLAVLTVPSSINMLIQMFPEPKEQTRRLAMFSMSGGVANTISLTIAGLFLLASWRWYFRALAIIIIVISIIGWFSFPPTEAVAGDLAGTEKWKRLDLGGVLMLMISIILLIVAFTQATVRGWGTALFIAPLIISITLLAAFIVWEQKMPRGRTLLPHDIWKFPNIFACMLMGTTPTLNFNTLQLRLAEFDQAVLGNSPILTAAKLLPMGVVSLCMGLVISHWPPILRWPKYAIPLAASFTLAGTQLIAWSGGGVGMNYWRYIFPGLFLASAGSITIWIVMNTTVIRTFPREFAGVSGSFIQTIFHLSGVVGIAVHGALLATGSNGGTLADWTGSRNGFFFTGGYCMAVGLVFLVWYRQPKREVKSGQVEAIGDV